VLFLSSGRTESLTCIIFLSEELLLTFLASQVYCWQIPSTSAWKSVSISLLKDNFTEYRRLCWWVSAFNTLNIFICKSIFQNHKFLWYLVKVKHYSVISATQKVEIKSTEVQSQPIQKVSKTSS
jgi:hypothetical protein